MQETVKRFKSYLKKMHAYDHASSVMFYDSETAMPKAGAADLGETLGMLSEVRYELGVSPELRDMLSLLSEHKDELDFVTRREVEELSTEFEKLEKIPKDEYVEGTKIVSAASACWHEAKVNNDFASFKPHLEKVVEYQKKLAGYVHPELAPYDSLLEEYEENLRMPTLDKFFGDVRAKLVPVVRDIVERGEKIDMAPFKALYPIDAQRRLTDYILGVMTISKDCCTVGEVEHPFTMNISKHDVRLTTHYHEDDMLSNFFSVIHEGGHSLYELNTGDDLIGSPLAAGANSSLHESQSRLFENLIGRSRAFTDIIYPKLAELFPAQFAGISREMLYRAANNSEPSLIRTEADELTYPMHIMVRYELEKQLIGGSLAVADLPEAWNAMYIEYLGVSVPDDRRGVLQDSHWSGGMFGYFPSYALGSAYASQMFAAMEKQLDVNKVISSGNLAPIVEYLTERIYKYGMLKKPAELIELSCGAPFDPSFYTDYLTKKYRELYKV